MVRICRIIWIRRIIRISPGVSEIKTWITPIIRSVAVIWIPVRIPAIVVIWPSVVKTETCSKFNGYTRLR